MSVRRFLIMVLAVAGILTVPVRAEINYLRLYLVGDATPGGWNEKLPEEMVAIGNNCFLWDGWLGKGELKFLNTRGDWDSSIVTSSPGLVFDTGVKYDLYYKHWSDNKFVNETPGYVRIIVDLGNMKVNFRRPALAFVGPAAKGWSLGDVIPVFADDEGNVSWRGQLRAGELKILADGAFDWTPCYNAPYEGDLITPGGHQMIFNTSDHDQGGNFVDFKYLVPRAGLYAFKFKNEGGGRFFGMDVTMDAEPDLTGGFRSIPGRYLAAIDRGARRVHFGPVPSRLYIGESGADCMELNAQGNDRFSSIVDLRRGKYYKLSSNPASWEASAISPNVDTDITSATSNLSPMHGYSYVVPEDGQYQVNADFSGNIPYLSAKRHVTSSVETVMDVLPRVKAIGGEITVEGDFTSVAVYDVSGRFMGCDSPCRVAPGTYIVRVDNNIFKISSR